MLEVFVQEVDTLPEAGGDFIPSLKNQLKPRPIGIVSGLGVEDVSHFVLEYHDLLQDGILVFGKQFVHYVLLLLGQLLAILQQLVPVLPQLLSKVIVQRLILDLLRFELLPIGHQRFIQVAKDVLNHMKIIILEDGLR